nr:hypothetical protein [Tanacetum cinerariifolium]
MVERSVVVEERVKAAAAADVAPATVAAAVAAVAAAAAAGGSGAAAKWWLRLSRWRWWRYGGEVGYVGESGVGDRVDRRTGSLFGFAGKVFWRRRRGGRRWRGGRWGGVGEK